MGFRLTGSLLCFGCFTGGDRGPSGYTRRRDVSTFGFHHVRTDHWFSVESLTNPESSSLSLCTWCFERSCRSLI